MGDFSQFYQQGGLFMHVITATVAAAITCVVVALRARADGRDPFPLLGLADRLAWVCMAEGAAGSMFAWIDGCAALRGAAREMQLDPRQLWEGAMHALAIVPTPIVWALLVAIPTWSAVGVLRVRFESTSP